MLQTGHAYNIILKYKNGENILYKRENELQDGMAIVSMYMQEMFGPIHRKDGVTVQPTTR